MQAREIPVVMAALCVLAAPGEAAAAIDPGPKYEARAEIPVPDSRIAKSRNLLPNGSFERVIGSAVPEYWGRFLDYVPACPEWRVAEGDAFHGDRFLKGSPGQELSVPAETRGLRTDDYVFSVYLKSAKPGARCEVSLLARPDVDDGRSPLQRWTRTVELTTDWRRYSLASKVNRHLDKNRWGIAGGLFVCGIKPLEEGVFVDAVQLEEGASPSEYAPPVVEIRGKLKEWPSSDRLQELCERLQQTPPEVPGPLKKGNVEFSVSFPKETAAGIYPVTGGIFFPRGALFDKDAVRVIGPGGREVTLQTEALARYGLDASIRSLYTAFLAGPAQAARGVYLLEYNTRPRLAKKTPLRIRETAEQVEIVTGPLRLAIRREASALFDGVWYDANGDGVFRASERVVKATDVGGLTVEDDRGVSWSSRWDRPLVVVERAGPIEAVVRVQGWHASPERTGHLAYVVRIHAYAGKSYVKVEHTFTNLDKALTTQVRSIALRVPREGVRAYYVAGVGTRALPGSQSGTGGAGRKLPGRARLLQTRVGHRDVWQLVEGGRRVHEGERAEGMVAALADRGACGVYVPYFWQTHPKEISVDSAGMTLYLWPRDGVKMLSLTHGVAKTHDIYLTFGRGAADLSWAEVRAAAAGIRPFADPAWTTSALRRAQDGRAAKRGLSASVGSYPVFDEMLRQQFVRLSQISKAQGLTGLFNFGDTLSGSGFWLNSETARPRAYLLQYLRTGDRDVFEEGKLAVRHSMDVDTDHVSGGQYVHNIHHAMGRPGSSHNYANMSSLYYLITGDRQACQVARHNADCRLGWAGRKLRGRSLGWTLWGLADVWDMTRERRFRYGALRLARRLEESASMKDGTRVSLSGGGFLGGGTCLNGLMRLHQGTGDEAVRRLFLDELNAIMFGAERRDRVRFRGRDCMMFAPLRYGYDLTRDTRYLRWGIKGLYGEMPYRSTPGFDYVLAAEILAPARERRIGEPISGGAPIAWGYKRRYTMYALDERDEPFTVTIYKQGGKEGSWVKVFAPDGALAAREAFGDAEQKRATLRIPADGQRGAYRFEVNQAYPTTVNLAVSLPKAVLRVAKDMFRMTRDPERYYFLVPEDTEEFRIGVLQAHGMGACGAAVYDPDGSVTKWHRWGGNMPDKVWQYLDIRPEPKHRGRLWSVSVAVAGQFKMSFEGVPPYVCYSPEAHFVPSEMRP